MGLKASADPGSREAGLDFGKLAAFVAVVFLHVGFPSTTPIPLVWVIDQTARFAVPFFFIASGYFLTKHLASPQWVAKYVFKRIIPALAFWVLFYHWAEIRDGHAKILRLIFLSGTDHLWFFPALAVSLLLASLLLRIGRLPALLVSAVLLYAVAVACGGEAQMFGVHHITWDTRLGPLFGLPFVTIGTVLARLRWRPGILAAASLFALGIGAQLGEDRLLAWDIGTTFLFPDFAAMTPLLGAGAFLFFQSLPTSTVMTRCSRPGFVVLGAYAVHPYLLGLPLAQHPTTSATFAVVAAVAVLALLASDILASYRPLSFAFK